MSGDPWACPCGADLRETLRAVTVVLTHQRIHLTADDAAEYDAAEPVWDTNDTARYKCGDCCNAVTAEQAARLEELLHEEIDPAAAAYFDGSYC